MSDNLEHMAETQNEVTQPTEAVVADVEANGSPQTDIENQEFYVEAEADQEETANSANQSNSDVELHARWVKEKEKRKRKNEELEAEKKRNEEMQRRLDELQGTVAEIKKGPPPTLESCDYNETVYQQKTREYFQPQAAVQQQQEQVSNQAPQQQSNSELEQAEFYLYKSEQELQNKLPDYAQNKSELVQKIKQFGGNEQTVIALANIAKQAGVDIAKANVALNKNPSLLAEINQVGGNPFAVADVLKRAEAKVQLRQSKPINTQPEPTINSSGPIDNMAKAVENAKQTWMADNTIESYNKYKALKKAAKQQG